jgi:bifunctional oligoribonuclease and PAP phosphatase NrnA
MTVAERSEPSLEQLIEEIGCVVEQSQDIGCLAHKDADADSLGSALAFASALRAVGKRAHPMVPEPTPLLLEYLPGFDTLEQMPERLDALFTFDCATLGRFGEKRLLVENTPCVVNVDHHLSSERFGSINLVDPAASATGQVVHRLLTSLGLPVSPEVATNLYAALFTDTGGFRHENTTEAALRLGADLVKAGANPAWVALKSYKSRSLAQLRLEGLALQRMQVAESGRLIWSEITQQMLVETGADMQHSEGVIDHLQSIDTMKIAILFKETAAQATKISVRTRDEYDATALCTPFGGGGHRRAAGAELAMPVPEARERVLQLAERLIRQAR